MVGYEEDTPFMLWAVSSPSTNVHPRSTAREYPVVRYANPSDKMAIHLTQSPRCHCTSCIA